jgi:hypothetical protein
MSADVGIESTDLSEPENMDITITTAALSSLERELRLLLLYRPPSCFRYRAMSADVGLVINSTVDIENIAGRWNFVYISYQTRY